MRENDDIPWAGSRPRKKESDQTPTPAPAEPAIVEDNCFVFHGEKLELPLLRLPRRE